MRPEAILSKWATVIAQIAVPASMAPPPSAAVWDADSRGLPSRANVAHKITTYGSTSRAIFPAELTSLSLASFAWEPNSGPLAHPDLLNPKQSPGAQTDGHRPGWPEPAAIIDPTPCPLYPRPEKKLQPAFIITVMDGVNQPRSLRDPDGAKEDALLRQANETLAATPTEQDVREASDLLKVVGDLTRMRLLCSLLPGEELSVGELQKALGMSQSAVSHQLRVLRDANLVKFRRSGKLVYYSLADEHVHKLLLGTLEHIRHD